MLPWGVDREEGRHHQMAAPAIGFISSSLFLRCVRPVLRSGHDERPARPEPESLILRHLQALRREVQALLEARLDNAKNFQRINTRLDRIDEDMHILRNEVAALDIKDISRHGELLQVLRKLAHVHEDGAGPGDFA